MRFLLIGVVYRSNIVFESWPVILQIIKLKLPYLKKKSPEEKVQNRNSQTERFFKSKKVLKLATYSSSVSNQVSRIFFVHDCSDQKVAIQ